MTVTRKQIRQAMLDEDIFGGLYGTATTGAPLQLTDTTLLKVAGKSSSLFGNYFLYRPAAATASDVVRRVTMTGYTSDDGILTHAGPAWTTDPLESSDSGYYELWKYDPVLVNRAITRAFQTRLFSIQQDDITTNGQTRYEVGASPFSLSSIESDDQILEVGQVWGTDPNARVRVWTKEGRTWWPEPDNDTLYIRFDPPPSGTIRITWKKPYTALSDDTTTSTVDKEWAVWASAFELFIGLSRAAQMNGETSANYDQLKDYAYGRERSLRRKFMNRWASQLITPRPRWRSSASAPRMGRGFTSALGGDGGRTI